MGNIEILALVAITMYVLFVIARRLWPKRSEDDRTTAPFVKRRQRAMIWSTVVVGMALVLTSVIWQTPGLLPQKLETRQSWSIQGSQGGIAVRGEGEQWIAPFSQIDQAEPLSIEYSRNRQTVRVVREAPLMPWTDENGAAIDAAEIISRLGVDSELTDLVRATMNESWVDGSLLQIARSKSFGPIDPYPAQPEIQLRTNRTSSAYAGELHMFVVMIIWTAAGMLIVAGLGFQRLKFKQREPAATLPA